MFLKRVLFYVAVLTLGVVVSLWATAFNITVTIDTAMTADILTTVTAWRVRQVGPDGVTPIYANNTALGQAFVYDGLRRVLKQQCEFDPVTCPPTIKAFLDTRNSAQTSFESGINSAVTP